MERNLWNDLICFRYLSIFDKIKDLANSHILNLLRLSKNFQFHMFEIIVQTVNWLTIARTQQFAFSILQLRYSGFIFIDVSIEFFSSRFDRKWNMKNCICLIANRKKKRETTLVDCEILFEVKNSFPLEISALAMKGSTIKTYMVYIIGTTTTKLIEMTKRIDPRWTSLNCQNHETFWHFERVATWQRTYKLFFYSNCRVN